MWMRKTKASLKPLYLRPSSNLRTLDTASDSSMVSGDCEATGCWRKWCWTNFKGADIKTLLPFHSCVKSFLVLTPPPPPSVVSFVCAKCVCVFGISGQFLAPCSSRAFSLALNSPSLCWTPGTLFCLSHSSLIHPLHLFYPSFSSALKPECPFPPPLY